MGKKQKSLELKPYRVKTKPLSGHNYPDIIPQARRIFRALQKQTHRRPYVRSAYFDKQKIFFDYFWQHMEEKVIADRVRRLRYFPCALELLRNTRHDPITFIDPTQPNMLVHRFLGIAGNGSRFWVLVKENRKTNRKQLLSLFPHK